MRQSRQQEFVLGIVVIAFLGLFVGTILFIYPALRYGTKRITVWFAHEQGLAPLKVGSPVFLSRSLQVGKVSDIHTRTVRRQGRPRLMIVVEAQIDRDLRLYRGCRITSGEPAVGGSGYLVILDVGPPIASRELDLSQPIMGLPPRSLAATMNELSERLLGRGGIVHQLQELLDKDRQGSLVSKIMLSLDDVNAMTRELRGQLSPRARATLMAKVHLILDDVNQTTAALRAQTSAFDRTSALAKVLGALDRLEAGLSQASAMLRENRPALRDALASAARASRAVDEELIAALRAELDRRTPSSLLAKLHVSMERLDRSLANVETVSQEGRKLVVLNRPLVERTVANLKELSEQAKLTIQSIYLAPWRLLRPPGAAEKRQRAIFEAARTFAEAATYLDDAAARLEAAAVAAEGRPLARSREEIRDIQASLRTAFARFERAEQFFWEKME